MERSATPIIPIGIYPRIPKIDKNYNTATVIETQVTQFTTAPTPSAPEYEQPHHTNIHIETLPDDAPSQQE